MTKQRSPSTTMKPSRRHSLLHVLKAKARACSLTLNWDSAPEDTYAVGSLLMATCSHNPKASNRRSQDASSSSTLAGKGCGTEQQQSCGLDFAAKYLDLSIVEVQYPSIHSSCTSSPWKTISNAEALKCKQASSSSLC